MLLGAVAIQFHGDVAEKVLIFGRKPHLFPLSEKGAVMHLHFAVVFGVGNFRLEDAAHHRIVFVHPVFGSQLAPVALGTDAAIFGNPLTSEGGGLFAGHD